MNYPLYVKTLRKIRKRNRKQTLIRMILRHASLSWDVKYFSTVYKIRLSEFKSKYRRGSGNW